MLNEAEIAEMRRSVDEADAKGLVIIRALLADRERLVRVVEAAKQENSGLSLGPWEQVSIVGPHFWYSVKALRDALAALHTEEPA